MKKQIGKQRGTKWWVVEKVSRGGNPYGVPIYILSEVLASFLDTILAIESHEIFTIDKHIELRTFKLVPDMLTTLLGIYQTRRKG